MLQEPGAHVVIVHYSDAHDMHWELVYNGPEIDGQKIVRAFDRGPVENLKLLATTPVGRSGCLSPIHPNSDWSFTLHRPGVVFPFASCRSIS